MGKGKRRAVNGVRRAPAPSGDPAPGRFVVLEGIDGAGKSEQARRLAAWLRERGERVVETREPTKGVWGQRYRAWARGDAQAKPEEVLRFFAEDRREHVARVIGPALEAGAIVVCDRYVASTLAYQAAQGLDRDWVVKRMEREHFPQPDLALRLRLPVAQALERLGPTAHERFERAAFLERVDAEYARLELLEIDATGSLDEVALAIQKRVEELFS
ncbi:MAG: dTMP kinase [Myxococcales bacterium]|nr:dTMP kinase [Myxococcales bacterium]MCZ6715292.1 dTMP kinase [Deltaproteobacteria bacterium]